MWIQVTQRQTGEVMVLKELLHYDEEANTSFLKEVSYLERVFCRWKCTGSIPAASFFRKLKYIRQLYSSSGKSKGGINITHFGLILKKKHVLAFVKCATNTSPHALDRTRAKEQRTFEIFLRLLCWRAWTTLMYWDLLEFCTETKL